MVKDSRDLIQYVQVEWEMFLIDQSNWRIWLRINGEKNNYKIFHLVTVGNDKRHW